MNPSAPTPDPRTVDGFPCLIWRCPRPWLAISSAPYGGGIGVRHWVLNSTVHRDYARPDPCEHVREMVRELGLPGPGVGMLTAVDVRREITVVDGLAAVSSTTGATHPIWAAAPEQVSDPVLPGTINAVCWSAVRLSEAALVNAVSTVAEAKAQALW